ncbi:CCN family member 1-like [Gopherus flavomarginatus]|uniref:CCN family member 1-like n=1 Tax=Gopherus flavomarginatus TaxID=286002 RepID=UPI0021CBC3AD|nr:CCN family member 1-like [Gopherus flavomarginatus]
MEQAALLSFVFLLRVALVVCRCPLQCVCPPSLPHCAPGVSTVPDGCGCCKVCARQLNDNCSKHWPCDPHRGLECNFGADPLASKGICRAKREGRTCEYNGRIYQNGENFQPSCKHQCSCIDGAVGCLPLCPLELPLASLSCPDPQLLKVPGQCCKKFVCGKGVKRFGEASFEGGETKSNELIYVGKDQHWKNLPAWPPLFKAHSVLRKCLTQNTDWSPCSKTCGLGASTRVTNKNPQCKLAKETQLCQIRPCGQPDFTKLKKGRKCLRTHKVQEPVHYTYAGCKSLHKYQPSYCGSCLDGCCCVPLHTRTLAVPFRCSDGDSFTRNVMVIHSCQCGPAHCQPLNKAAVHPQQRLDGDMHKFLE